MVMKQQDARSVGKDTALKDLSGRYDRLIDHSDGNNIHVNHLILGVKIQYSEYFSIKGSKFIGQKLDNVFRRIQNTLAIKRPLLNQSDLHNIQFVIHLLPPHLKK